METTEPKSGDIVAKDGKFFRVEEPGEDWTEITEDEAAEAGFEVQPNPSDLRQQPGDPGAAAVRRAGKSPEEAKAMSHEERRDAVEWFMSDDPDEAPATNSLELNVSTNPEEDIWIEWIVKALPRERIQDIRDKAKKKGKRRRRGGEEEDSNAAVANLRIAAEGTEYPNLRDDRVRGEFLDPADALNYRFRNKPGLIDQICAAVIEVSGYDEEDVRETDAVKT